MAYFDNNDIWMLLPIFIKFLMTLILSMLSPVGKHHRRRFHFKYFSSDTNSVIIDEQFGGGFFLSFIALIIQLIANTVPHYLKTKSMCGDNKFNYLGKAFVDGTIENGVASVISTILRFTPVIGMFFSLFGKWGSDIAWTIGYICCKFFINTINYFRGICDTNFFGTTSDTISFVIFLIISLFYSFI